MDVQTRLRNYASINRMSGGVTDAEAILGGGLRGEDVDLLRTVLSAEPAFAYATGGASGLSPLGYAIRTQSFEAALVLLEHGAPVYPVSQRDDHAIFFVLEAMARSEFGADKHVVALMEALCRTPEYFSGAGPLTQRGQTVRAWLDVNTSIDKELAAAIRRSIPPHAPIPAGFMDQGSYAFLEPAQQAAINRGTLEVGGYSPFALAVLHGARYEVCTRLFAMSDLTASMPYGETAGYVALRNGNEPVARFIAYEAATAGVPASAAFAFNGDGGLRAVFQAFQRCVGDTSARSGVFLMDAVDTSARIGMMHPPTSGGSFFEVRARTWVQTGTGVMPPPRSTARPLTVAFAGRAQAAVAQAQAPAPAPVMPLQPVRKRIAPTLLKQMPSAQSSKRPEPDAPHDGSSSVEGEGGPQAKRAAVAPKGVRYAMELREMMETRGSLEAITEMRGRRTTRSWQYMYASDVISEVLDTADAFAAAPTPDEAKARADRAMMAREFGIELQDGGNVVVRGVRAIMLLHIAGFAGDYVTERVLDDDTIKEVEAMMRAVVTRTKDEPDANALATRVWNMRVLKLAVPAEDDDEDDLDFEPEEIPDDSPLGSEDSSISDRSDDSDYTSVEVDEDEDVEFDADSAYGAGGTQTRRFIDDGDATRVSRSERDEEDSVEETQVFEERPQKKGNWSQAETASSRPKKAPRKRNAEGTPLPDESRKHLMAAFQAVEKEDWSVASAELGAFDAPFSTTVAWRERDAYGMRTLYEIVRWTQRKYTGDNALTQEKFVELLDRWMPPWKKVAPASVTFAQALLSYAKQVQDGRATMDDLEGYAKRYEQIPTISRKNKKAMARVAERTYAYVAELQELLASGKRDEAEAKVEGIETGWEVYPMLALQDMIDKDVPRPEGYVPAAVIDTSVFMFKRMVFEEPTEGGMSGDARARVWPIPRLGRERIDDALDKIRRGRVVKAAKRLSGFGEADFQKTRYFPHNSTVKDSDSIAFRVLYEIALAIHPNLVAVVADIFEMMPVVGVPDDALAVAAICQTYMLNIHQRDEYAADDAVQRMRDRDPSLQARRKHVVDSFVEFVSRVEFDELPEAKPGEDALMASELELPHGVRANKIRTRVYGIYNDVRLMFNRMRRAADASQARDIAYDAARTDFWTIPLGNFPPLMSFVLTTAQLEYLGVPIPQNVTPASKYDDPRPLKRERSIRFRGMDMGRLYYGGGRPMDGGDAPASLNTRDAIPTENRMSDWDFAYGRSVPRRGRALLNKALRKVVQRGHVWKAAKLLTGNGRRDFPKVRYFPRNPVFEDSDSIAFRVLYDIAAEPRRDMTSMVVDMLEKMPIVGVPDDALVVAMICLHFLNGVHAEFLDDLSQPVERMGHRRTFVEWQRKRVDAFIEFVSQVELDELPRAAPDADALMSIDIKVPTIFPRLHLYTYYNEIRILFNNMRRADLQTQTQTQAREIVSSASRYYTSGDRYREAYSEAHFMYPVTSALLEYLRVPIPLGSSPSEYEDDRRFGQRHRRLDFSGVSGRIRVGPWRVRNEEDRAPIPIRDALPTAGPLHDDLPDAEPTRLSPGVRAKIAKAVARVKAGKYTAATKRGVADIPVLPVFDTTDTMLFRAVTHGLRIVHANGLAGSQIGARILALMIPPRGVTPHDAALAQLMLDTITDHAMTSTAENQRLADAIRGHKLESRGKSAKVADGESEAVALCAAHSHRLYTAMRVLREAMDQASDDEAVSIAAGNARQAVDQANLDAGNTIGAAAYGIYPALTLAVMAELGAPTPDFYVPYNGALNTPPRMVRVVSLAQAHGGTKRPSAHHSHDAAKRLRTGHIIEAEAEVSMEMRDAMIDILLNTGATNRVNALLQSVSVGDDGMGMVPPDELRFRPDDTYAFRQLYTALWTVYNGDGSMDAARALVELMPPVGPQDRDLAVAQVVYLYLDAIRTSTDRTRTETLARKLVEWMRLRSIAAADETKDPLARIDADGRAARYYTYQVARELIASANAMDAYDASVLARQFALDEALAPVVAVTQERLSHVHVIADGLAPSGSPHLPERNRPLAVSVNTQV